MSQGANRDKGRQKTKFTCQECGYESSGWLGKCPECGNWNTFIEERIKPESTRASRLHSNSSLNSGSGSGFGSGFGSGSGFNTPVSINDVELVPEERLPTGIGEMDRVLGGGIVKGSLVLVGGDPGIGKSTLLLQVCGKLPQNVKVLYISGEESVKQIKMRSERLGILNPKLAVISETDYDAIIQLLETVKPDIAVIDSIQTVFSSVLTSAPGSVSQVRDATSGFMRLAKETGISVIIVGHVTKEGAIAGPKALEHIVDTVLYFEGEKNMNYRILRAVKNRFGSTNEIGIFEMRESGLTEVENPSMALLSGRPPNVPGSAIVASIEGTRPILLEIQALVCPTSFGTPRRMAIGADYNRITILMAVMEKSAGMELHNFDAYISVAGGLRVDEPACDLAIVTAVASSLRNVPVDPKTVLIGEVGLTGEVRAVTQTERRISEAARLGFKTCIIPKSNSSKVLALGGNIPQNIEIVKVSNIREAISASLV